MLKLLGNHLRLQDESKRQSKLSEAVRLTADEVAQWWVKEKFEVKTRQGVVQMLDKLYKEWKYLKDTRNRNSDSMKLMRAKFTSDLPNTFWVLNPEFEEKLSKSNDPAKMEDWNFLVNMKTSRIGSVGPVDGKDEKRQKRKSQKMQIAFTSSACQDHLLANIEPDGENRQDTKNDTDDDTGDIYAPPAPARRTSLRMENVMTPEMCMVADKAKL